MKTEEEVEALNRKPAAVAGGVERGFRGKMKYVLSLGIDDTDA